MKKILLLLIFPLLFACSSDDEKELTQDYTSFVFEQTVNNDLPNCITAFKKDGKYYKLGDLGSLSKGKQSSEIRVNDNSITEIFFFTDYISPRRFDFVFRLNKNTKNIFKLTEDMGGIIVTDKTDPTQYPQ